MTQNEMILALLRTGKWISPLDALRECGTMKLATRISELRRKGYDIETRYVPYINRFGKKMYHNEYRLRGEAA